MSKKKATMTLKDFHGGSIPSDLPLPSAPGVSVRPVGFERQLSWGNSVARPDQRLRPASAGSARNLDEKSPFLSNTSFIGRNFDEDERKPLDGVSGTRRMIGSDESVRAHTSHMVEPKTDNISGPWVSSRAVSSPVSQTSSGSSGSSYAVRVSEVHNPRLNNQTVGGGRSYGSNYPTMGGNAGQGVGGSYPNAWGIKKEPATMKEHVSSAWSAPDAETKLAHASALEKISSGRWNSKQHVHTLKDAEVFGPSENGTEIEYSSNNMNNKKNYNRLEVVAPSDYNEVALMIHAERSRAVSDGGGKLVPTYERSRSSTIPIESFEGNTSVTSNGFQSLHTSGISGGDQLPAIFPSEPSERPKLKLLPRSKPLENVEPPVDYKQGYEQTNDNLHVVDTYVLQEPKNFTQPGFAGPMVGDQGPERPKLNLKPRSQPREQLEGKREVRRGTVFGGARPREMVLKERGIEDDASSYESQSPMRVKEGAPKADALMLVNPTSYSRKGESIPNDQRIAKFSDGERGDPHGRNRQNETWRNTRDVDKHRNIQQPKQMPDNRPPSPETWRKPVSSDTPPMRYGKAASAVELAQAFSKSVSDPTVAERLSGPSRGIPSRSQMPFSRLMGGPTPRAQINGY